ncbi:hypothetical protein AK830_g3375 [Neonectria ditissima]|uniref:5'-deoxynucleotidase n=1 Tax=Neonectria ditissima TaxID=78410 RepID=A0A0N8H7Z5_9HYPO|nr:hypothetical protein AK830_g3375 [Neonectria ditissima]
MTVAPNPSDSSVVNEEAIPQWTAKGALERLIGKLEETITRELLLFRIATKLKAVDRAGWIRHGIENPESVAAHSWGMTFLALFVPLESIDRSRVVFMAIIHDLAEVLVGDVTPHDPISRKEKKRREDETMDLLASMLSKTDGEYILGLWREFEDGKTKESLVAQDLDKIDMVLQALTYEESIGRGKLDEFMHAVNKIKTPELKSFASKILQGRNEAKDDAWSRSTKKIDEYYRS